MTATLVSLISIFIGIISANILGLRLKKYSFGIVGNTIAGVFGSVFLIKSFGRLGFSPNYIVVNGIVHINPLLINLVFSMIGGALSLILMKKLQLRLKLN